jgi:hypothetical protein
VGCHRSVGLTLATRRRRHGSLRRCCRGRCRVTGGRSRHGPDRRRRRSRPVGRGRRSSRASWRTPVAVCSRSIQGGDRPRTRRSVGHRRSAHRRRRAGPRPRPRAGRVEAAAGRGVGHDGSIRSGARSRSGRTRTRRGDGRRRCPRRRSGTTHWWRARVPTLSCARHHQVPSRTTLPRGSGRQRGRRGVRRVVVTSGTSRAPTARPNPGRTGQCAQRRRPSSNRR